MSFGENKPQRIEQLTQLVRFMAQAMMEHGYPEKAPACWQHILRELRKAGVEVD